VNFKISDSKKKFLFAVALTFCVAGWYSSQDTSAGTAALTQVTTDIQKYIPIVQKLVYAIAGVVAVIGAVSVYIKMNNEEQDVKKSIMMIIGACIFLVAAATALPAFFGL
jgi:type IV secretory pathway VirB2 component (pilin)